MLDRLKDLGFKYSTVAGISVGVADVVVSSKKKDLLKQGDDKLGRSKSFIIVDC